MIEELAEHLAQNSTRLALGDNLFINVLPESTGAAAAIIETGGLAAEQTFQDGAPQIERPRVQILTRSTRPVSGAVPYSTTAGGMIHDAYHVLNGVASETIQGSSYLRVEPVQSPFSIGQDEAARLMFSCNFDVWRRGSTSV